MCRNCNSLVCYNCIENVSNTFKTNIDNIVNCLECETILNLVDIQKITRKGLDMLHIKCPSYNIKCNQEIQIKDLYSHLDSCEYFDGKSKCTGCEIIDWTKNIKNHVEICKEFLEKCRFCDFTEKRNLIKDHEKSCNKRPKNCNLCCSNIEYENLNFHPSKDICMINFLKDVKEQFESKLIYLLIIK